MRSCPTCRAPLPDSTARCPACEWIRPRTAARPPQPSRMRPEELNTVIEELLQPWEPPPDASQPPMEDELPDAPSASERSRLPDELARDLTDFTLQFVRAVTKSSYYTAGHQEADKAKLGLYGAFTQLVADRPEITFFAHTAGERRSMLVYGIFDEPTELAQVMLKGMADLYIPKLAHYFESNALLSISFKRALSEAEFVQFVDLLAVPASAAPGAAARLTRQFAERGIRNISVVHQEDRLAGRRLSWRVEMALSRLKKDLSVIPLYRHLGDEERRQVRLQVFRDVLRPLRQVNLIRELLENCDLVVDEVNEFSRDQVAEIEGQVLRCVLPASLPLLLQGLAQDIVESRRQGGERPKRLIRIARRVAQRLGPEQARNLEEPFRKLLADGALTFDELPVFVQEKLILERHTDLFLHVRDEFLQHFGAVTEPDEYHRYLDFFSSIFVELIARRDLSAPAAILDRVAAHRDASGPFEQRAALASAWLDDLARAVGDPLAKELAAADKVQRESLVDLARSLGEGVVPPLFGVLRECESASTRQAVEDLLADLKQATQRFVARELAGADLPTPYLGELLRVLSRVGSPRDARLAATFLDHADGEVRAEALQAACQLDESSAEPWSVRALGSLDAKLQTVALQQLFQRRSAAPELFAFCDRLFGHLDEENERMAGWVCTELANYGRGPGRDRCVKLLLRVLDDGADAKGGWWSSLKTSVATSRPSHRPVKVEACRALAHLRAQEAVDLLTRLSKNGPKPLQQAALHALKKIRGA